MLRAATRLTEQQQQGVSRGKDAAMLAERRAGGGQATSALQRWADVANVDMSNVDTCRKASEVDGRAMMKQRAAQRAGKVCVYEFVLVCVCTCEDLQHGFGLAIPV